MAISDYVIEYKAVSLAEGQNEIEDATARAKLDSYIAAGTMTEFLPRDENQKDIVRVWTNQATLNEYKTWWSSNGKTAYESANTSAGNTVSKTEFTAS